MTLNYTSYVNQLANLMVIASTDSNFTTFLPGCIDYAEQRIYRELDFLNTRVTDTSGTFTAASRNFALPTSIGTFIIVENMNAISNSSGTRNQMVPVTKEFLDAVYPNTTTTGTPQYFAPISNTQYIVGPAPNVNFTAEVIGVQRPTALSSTNTSTFLTTYCPDLFIAASMVFATGFQRDFGAESDDPKASGSWEQQYQALLASAAQEQLRQRYEGAAWTPMVMAQVQPPRV